MVDIGADQVSRVSWFFTGNDGCLDFGAVRVFKEVNRCITLKNKGKYELAYK